MNEFQWLLVLGFPAEVAAASAMPRVFAAPDATTANDRTLQPERRDSPVIPGVLRPAPVFVGPL
ncbi:MAG: hypothetical protein HZA93_26770 [Verrucomicrobia bacterium]|nr:hypothetical protein [Verrucomicrobiota bacterium]